MPTNTTTTKSLLKKNVEARPTRLTDMPSKFPSMNERLKASRDKLNMSQEAFAKFLSTPSIKVSKSTIKAIEGNVVAVNHFIIIRWKKKCNVSYNWIYEGKD